MLRLLAKPGNQTNTVRKMALQAELKETQDKWANMTLIWADSVPVTGSKFRFSQCTHRSDLPDGLPTGTLTASAKRAAA